MLDFRQKEVVIYPPKKIKEEGYQTGGNKILEATVVFTGGKCELGYNPGDEILFDESIATPGSKKTLLGTDYWILDERYIICKKQ